MLLNKQIAFSLRPLPLLRPIASNRIHRGSAFSLSGFTTGQLAMLSGRASPSRSPYYYEMSSPTIPNGLYRKGRGPQTGREARPLFHQCANLSNKPLALLFKGGYRRGSCFRWKVGGLEKRRKVDLEGRLLRKCPLLLGFIGLEKEERLPLKKQIYKGPGYFIWSRVIFEQPPVERGIYLEKEVLFCSRRKGWVIKLPIWRKRESKLEGPTMKMKVGVYLMCSLPPIRVMESGGR